MRWTLVAVAILCIGLGAFTGVRLYDATEDKFWLLLYLAGGILGAVVPLTAAEVLRHLENISESLQRDEWRP